MKCLSQDWFCKKHRILSITKIFKIASTDARKFYCLLLPILKFINDTLYTCFVFCYRFTGSCNKCSGKSHIPFTIATALLVMVSCIIIISRPRNAPQTLFIFHLLHMYSFVCVCLYIVRYNSVTCGMYNYNHNQDGKLFHHKTVCATSL